VKPKATCHFTRQVSINAQASVRSAIQTVKNGSHDQIMGVMIKILTTVSFREREKHYFIVHTLNITHTTSIYKLHSKVYLLCPPKSNTAKLF